MALIARYHVVFLLLTAILTVSTAQKSGPKSQIGSKKILVLLPVAAPSHHNIFSALTNELLDRGHYVTIVSARAQKTKHPRLREVLIKDPFEHFLRDMTVQSFKGQRGIMENTLMVMKMGPLFNQGILESKEVLALKNENFDLVIAETFFFQEPLLGFAHHYGCPSMAVNPIGYTSHLNYYTGGAVNPSYVNNFFAASEGGLDSVFARLQNTLLNIIWGLAYQFFYIPEANALLHKVFPEAPHVQDLVRNVSLTLINNNAALMDAVPLAPSVIEVAGIHIKPGKPLAADLKKWIEDSKDGVVYFSLGSNVNPSLLPPEKQDAIFRSFGKLKQRVLVKWNGEIPANAPKNCRFEEWVSQQEVLAHPNLKVFVSHGGLLSTQEAVYYGAAVVAMPVFGDQHMNAVMATKQGFAVTVTVYELTSEILDAALNEVINNPKYRERSKELSLRFRLEPITSREKAVHYTEQLMKLGNFNHLRPSSVNLHWYQYLLLDVIAVIAVILYITYRVIRCVCSACLGCCRKSSKSKKD